MKRIFSTCCGVSLSEVISRACQIMEQLAELNIFPEGRPPAGFLTIYLPVHRCPVLHVLIGDPPNGKVTKYSTLSREKAERLSSHSGQVSSWQSRNTSDHQYGGAIQTDKGPIISFSGLPEEADEALGLELARQLGWIRTESIEQITAVHVNNSFYDDLHS